MELAANDGEADNAGDTDNVADGNNTNGETRLTVNNMVNAVGDTANAAADYDLAEVDLKQAFKNLFRFACKDIVKSHPSSV